MFRSLSDDDRLQPKTVVVGARTGDGAVAFEKDRLRESTLGCGPTILLVVGVQASATVITGFQLLIPVAIAMLVAGLLLVGRQVDPALV